MRGDELVIRTAWDRHVGRGRDAAGELEGLLERHRDPTRQYHGLSHLAWVIRHIHDLAASEAVSDLGAIVAAGCFHDAVLRPDGPGGDADERASAALARDVLERLGWSAPRTTWVHDAIVATAHLAAPPVADPRSTDLAVLLDADLAILGADANAYDAYRRGVRAEYAHLDDAAWRRGRRAAVEQLASMDPIYRTDTARRRWEHHAHANLAAELSSLDDPG